MLRLPRMAPVRASATVELNSAGSAATDMLAGGALARSAYLRGLADRLKTWVDLTRIGRLHDSPLTLLRAVCDHEGAVVPADFLCDPSPDKLEDEAWLDQAALLYRRIRRATQTSEPDHSLSSLRAPYLTALRAELGMRRMISGLLLPASAASVVDPAFFDGFALRNVWGKTFAEIAALPQFAQQPGLAGLSPEQCKERLRARFAEIGEDTQYPVGSVAHSLASTVLRIQSWQNAAPLSSDASTEAWARAFAEQEARWARERDYPLHPRVLFALHLAVASNAQFVDDDWRERLWLEILSRLPPPVALSQVGWVRVESAIDVPAFASGQLGRLRNSLTPAADESEAQLKRRALTRLFEEVEDGCLGREKVLNHPLGVSGRVQYEFRMKRWRQNFQPLQAVLLPHLAREKIAGKGWDGKLQALMHYAGERLRATFETAPALFSREEAAAECLRHLGMSESALRQRRHYTISSINFNIQDSRFGSPVEELLARADQGGMAGGSMRVAGQSIDARASLQRAEEQYNRNLKSDSWVRARARENLRQSGRVLLHGEVEAEVARLAANFACETENHRALMRGLETWVNTVPVLGPIYNIVNGIAHQRPWQAVLGTLFLGLDALDLFSGGEAAASAEDSVAISAATSESVSLSGGAATEHAPLLDVRAHQMQASIRQLRQAFGADAPGAGLWRGRRANDPFGVKNENAPAPAASIVRRVAGEVPETVRGVPPAERLTCSGVKALIDAAPDLAVRDFDALFDRHFRIELHGEQPTRFDARAFYRSLYQDSPTFRRLANRFTASLPADEVWRIHVGDTSKPLGTYTHGSGKAIYLQGDEELAALRYMSSEGWTPMRVEQAYLHEMLHAMTGAADPESFLDLLNRGPIVYLTDRILTETGRTFPQQVMYRRKDPASGMARHDSVEGNRTAAAEAMEVENRYLERVLARQEARGRGVEWARQSISAIVERIRAPEGAAAGVQRVNCATGMLLPDLYARLEERSPTLRRLLSATDDTSRPWHVEWSGHGSGRLDRVRRQIVLAPPENRYYLHERGAARMEAPRRVCEALVEALGGFERLQGAAADGQRGPVVILAQKILEEAGFHYPRRLSAAEAGADALSALLAWRTPAARRAGIEDAALAEALERDASRESNRVQLIV